MPALNDRGKGIVGTIVFHGLIVILLILFGFTTPLPLPAEQGILINFGTSNEGMGISEPRDELGAPKPESAAAQKQEEESPLTQDNEDAPSLTVKKENTEKNEAKDKKAASLTGQEKGEKEVEKPREANKKALFPGKKTDGEVTGEGETGKTGNQGGEEGSIDSQNRIGSTGGGGSAEKGIIANLNGRTALSLPPPEYPNQERGRVVVEVTVDQRGNITKAIPGVTGSTTLNSELLRAAEKAALNAKFNVNFNAPPQVGTITYIFKLQ